ncbi:MAG: radical SAM family heme chaperone HemW [Chloroflexi bacterium]|nr:radical SAM family heme chaperone HemW [Chloroflexota bacterium]
MPEYVTALASEIKAWGTLLDHPQVGTIFFGGGTPSYLPTGDIETLLTTVRDAFKVAGDAEITLESNPGDLEASKLAAYRDQGINRLSIGVQSFDDGLLSLLGRRHDAATAVSAFEAARSAGFENVSIDLMFGLPHQTREQWGDTLSQCLSLSPEHTSLYALTLEPNTPMELSVKSGELPEPDPDLAADMYLDACDALERVGYSHYEISNWARAGLESRHNLAYWRSSPYLGVGPGAHSYVSGHRFANLKSPRSYIDRMATDFFPLAVGDVRGDPVEAMRRDGPVSDVEEAIMSNEISDAFMMGLRLSGGISASAFEKRFGMTLRDARAEQIDELVIAGMLESDEAGIRIPHDRWLMGNEVFVRFIDDSISARVSPGLQEAPR